MKGNRNKHIVIFSCIMIAIMIIALVIDMMFVDNRENMTGKNEMFFNESIIEIVDKTKDEDHMKIDLTELYMIGSNKDFTIELTDQDNNTINYTMTKGKTVEEEIGGMILETQYSIVFQWPENLYFIKINIVLDNISDSTAIDYRDFRSVSTIK